jgi:hypothetical protein
MKVVKKTGLVPVHTKQETRIFGVLPTVAAKGVAAGSLFLAEIPEGIETIEFATAEPKKAESPVEVDGVVQIPEDWEALHYASQIVLAKTIVGGDLPAIEGKKPADVARDIIREELTRRAAGGAPSTAE